MEGCRKKASDTNCVLMGEPNRATTVVLVKGTNDEEDDRAFRFVSPDPEKAAAQALGDCQKKARNCHLALAIWDSGNTWSVVARGDDALRLIYNDLTQEEAENGALADCEKTTSKKGSCKIVPDLTTNGHAWYAFAHSEVYSGVGVSSTGKSQAKENALKFCRDGNASSPCKITEVFENTGPTAAPAAFKKLQARIEREKKQRQDVAKKSVKNVIPASAQNCRPRTEYLRCSSQCTNGSCFVTYENGCKLRI